MATYYVATTGSNDNDGSIGLPWLTLNKAITTIVGGDTVYVRGGTYAEVLGDNENFPAGSAGAFTKLIGYPGETVIIMPNSGFRCLDLANSAPTSYVLFEDLIFDGTNVGYDACKLGNVDPHITFNRCTMRNAPNQGLLTGSDDDYLIVSNCEIYNNGVGSLEHGIYANGDFNLIENNWIHDNTGYGIQWNELNATNNTIRGNRVERNTNGGMALLGSNFLVYNNVIRTSVLVTPPSTWGGTDGIRIQLCPNLKIYNNTFVGYATTTGCLNAGCGGQGSAIRGLHGSITSPITVQVYNNIMVRNNGSGILNDDPNETYRNNLIIDGQNNYLSSITDPNPSSTYSGNLTGKVDTDVMFLDMWTSDPTTEANYQEDLHILINSPCKNAGLDLSGTFTTDKEGNVRSSWDIGAYEFVETSSASVRLAYRLS